MLALHSYFGREEEVTRIMKLECTTSGLSDRSRYFSAVALRSSFLKPWLSDEGLFILVLPFATTEPPLTF
jgi:hypothetical protein